MLLVSLSDSCVSCRGLLLLRRNLFVRSGKSELESAVALKLTDVALCNPQTFCNCLKLLESLHVEEKVGPKTLLAKTCLVYCLIPGVLEVGFSCHCDLWNFSH